MSSDRSSSETNAKAGALLPSFAPQQVVRVQGIHALVRVITRRLKWIVGSVVICEVLAVAIAIWTSPVYSATATIEVNEHSGTSLDFGLGDVLSQQLSSGGDALQIDEQTETAILQGDSLALAVIQRLGLASQPSFSTRAAKDKDSEKGLPLEEAPKRRTRLLAEFKANLKVAPIRGTRLITVTYENHDPQLAAQIANAIIESYKTQYLESHYQATSEASDWLTKQLSDLKGNVEDSEKQLTDFEKESGILSLDVAPSGSASSSIGGGQIHSVVIEKLDALNGELTAAEANRIEKEAIYHLVESGNGDVILGLNNDPLAVQSKSLVLTQGGGISNLEQLQQQQNELKINLAQASATFGANNRHLKEMNTQLRALGDQIDQETQRIIKRAQGDLQLAQQTESELRRRFDQQQVEASKVNEKAVQFAVLSQEASSRKRLYEDLYTKLQEANVSAGMTATNISIVDPARSQSIPVRPKRLSDVEVGLLFGILVGIAAAYAADNVDRTVSDPLELEEITGRPVIGFIPEFAERSNTYGKRLVQKTRQLKKKRNSTQEERIAVLGWVLNHPDSAAAEAFRALRTTIMLSRAAGTSKIILVTSCTSGEGKSTVTMNLAIAFAQHNKRVIVVKADMRQLSTEHKTNAANEVGLSNVLAGTCSCDEAIKRGVYLATLDVLPAGPRPPLPADMVGSPAFEALLQQLRTRYEIILVDSPPALMVTDAVIIASKADAVIWVARAGVISRPHLIHATRLIERDGIPVIGFVLNRINKSVAEYGYGYESHSSYYGEDNPHAA